MADNNKITFPTSMINSDYSNSVGQTIKDFERAYYREESAKFLKRIASKPKRKRGKK